MDLINMSNRDFDRKFSGVMMVDGSLYSHSERDGNTILGRILDTNMRWKDYRTTLEDAHIDYSFPDMGYVNYKGGVVYAVRIARRQWSVIYNSNVVTCVDPVENLRPLVGLEVVDISNNPHFIYRLFHRNYFSYEGAIAQLRKGARLSAAINKHIALSQSSAFGGRFVIYYKNKVCGWIDEMDKAILFKEADYVAAVCPFPVAVEEK